MTHSSGLDTQEQQERAGLDTGSAKLRGSSDSVENKRGVSVKSVAVSCVPAVSAHQPFRASLF